MNIPKVNMQLNVSLVERKFVQDVRRPGQQQIVMTVAESSVMDVGMILLIVLASKRSGARIVGSNKKNAKTAESCPVYVVALVKMMRTWMKTTISIKIYETLSESRLVFH